MPTRIAATANTISCATGSVKSMKSTRATSRAPSAIPSRIPSAAADRRGDDALVSNHPPHLPAGHPDRAQHPDLTRPLEDGEDERVHDPEEAHEDREREQDVEDVEHRAEAGDLVVDELLARLHLGVGELLQRPVERGFVRVRLAAAHDHERVEVLRLVVEPVPGLRRDRDRAERRPAGRRLEDAQRPGRGLIPRWGRSLETTSRPSGRDRPRSPLSTKAPSLPSWASTASGAFFPVEREDPARRGVDRGGVEHAAERLRLAGPDAADEVHAGRRARRLPRR